MLSVHEPLFAYDILAGLMFSPSLSAGTGEELIEWSGVHGGLVVVLNSEQLVSEIQPNRRYLVQGLFKDEESKVPARDKLESKETYGAVAVKSWNGDGLPYLDNMVNLVIADDDSSVSLDEVLRVLAPYGVMTVETPITVKPTQHIHLKGIRCTGRARTFMETKEPLLRSDWTIYRGDAVYLRGTEDISITDCHLDQVGGNTVFVDG
jgi:hypothetical protein